MTNIKVGCIIGGVVAVCVAMAMVFVFGTGGPRRSGKCSLTMFIPAELFIYTDVPLLSITSLIMFYAFYHYYKMARKTQPEGSGHVGNLKAQVKVTRTMFTVVGVFLSSNILWYTVFLITDDMDGMGIAILMWFCDGLWLVSTSNPVKPISNDKGTFLRSVIITYKFKLLLMHSYRFYQDQIKIYTFLI